MLAEVIVDLAVAETDRTYTYRVPEPLREKVSPGHWVRVPFGRRKTMGLIVKLGVQPPADPVELKSIDSLVGERPALTQELMDLVAWMSEYYGCLYVQSLRTALPAGLRRDRWRTRQETVYRLSERADVGLISPRARKQHEAFAWLAAHPDGCTSLQLRKAGISLAAIHALEQRGLVIKERQRAWRSPFRQMDPGGESVPQLNRWQMLVLSQIREGAGERETSRRTFLLHGVTGSGKTEIYLRLIADQLECNRQSIVLVPEISLTPQLVERFRNRLGDRVAVLHSALSDGERMDEWERIRMQQVDVVVGARSAIFAPLERLGLIVIDEEHENSYKQEESPRYHAREVAMERARRNGAMIVLGSATPSVRSYYYAERGKLRLLTMPERANRRPLPSVRLVDMRRELADGNRSMFSRALQENLARCLSRHEQAILFLNRRGYSTFVLCRECGQTVDCPNCSLSLTYHAGSGLRCHYCDYRCAAPEICPSCGSSYIRYFGTGTQKLEELTRKTFPEARILRMDVDTTGRKGSHEQIFRRFRNGEADILIGTQMIAKGWDIENVTLVGVVAADLSLRLPDPYSAERTFQLLTQVAGRAGRGSRAGQVIVQTYQPQHFAIVAAAAHDYRSFYEQEIQRRRQLGFDPFRRTARWMVSSTSAEEAARIADRLATSCRSLIQSIDQGEQVEIVGPAPSILYRLRGEYRYQLLVWAPRREWLLTLHERLEPIYEEARRHEVRVGVDIDPLKLI